MTIKNIEPFNAMLIDEKEYPVTFIFNSITKRFGENFRETHAYIINYKENKFVSAVKKIARDSMSEDDSFYIENINGHDNQFTVFGRGPTAKVYLLKKSCSCWKYDLI